MRSLKRLLLREPAVHRKGTLASGCVLVALSALGFLLRVELTVTLILLFLGARALSQRALVSFYGRRRDRLFVLFRILALLCLCASLTCLLLLILDGSA